MEYKWIEYYSIAVCLCVLDNPPKITSAAFTIIDNGNGTEWRSVYNHTSD